MAFNISVAASTLTELESYEWYTSAGVSLKNVRTYLFQSTAPSGWVDVSNYVRSIRITGSVTNLSGEPGTNDAFIELDNLDKRFTDINTTGPYYGNLNPNQPMKVVLSAGIESITIFNGRVAQNGFVETRQGQAGVATVNIFDDAYAFMRKKFDKDYFYENKKLVDEDDAGNSLLHILLQNHASLLSANLVTNGAVACTVPYAVFREGESFQDVIRDIATASLASYAGFRHDGKYVFDSRLVAGWSEPTAEYVLKTESHNVDLTKEIISLIGNNVKVRGVNDFSRDNVILWDLSKIKTTGGNTNYPHDCWELVSSGEFYLGTPTDPFIMEYTAGMGELLRATSMMLNVKVKPPITQPRWDWVNFVTTGTDLDAEETKGELVLQSSSLGNIYVMGAKVTGRAIVRRNLSGVPGHSTGPYGGAGGAAGSGYMFQPTGFNKAWEDDDLNWGRIGVQSNASSILQYGQTDLVISSEMICGNTQLDNVLQWHLLNGKDPKHMFVVGNLPFMAFMQPGAPVWMNLTDLGFSGMVTVQSFEHNITPDTADTTLSLLENPGDWLVSTGASIRDIYAAGSGGTGPGELGPPSWGGNLVYTVGSLGCSAPCDIVCDGVDDQNEINAGIDSVEALGGGLVSLIGTEFSITSTVNLKSNVTLNIDAGVEVRKSGDAAERAISAVGTGATHLSSVAVIGLGKVTMENGTSTCDGTLYFQDTDGVLVKDITIDHSPLSALKIIDCTDVLFDTVTVKRWKQQGVDNAAGIWLQTANLARVTGCIVDGMSTAVTATGIYEGIYADGPSIVESNRVKGMRGTGYWTRAIDVHGDDCEIDNNVVEDIDLSTSLVSCYGIFLDGDRGRATSNRVRLVTNSGKSQWACAIVLKGDKLMVNNNYCYNNGADHGIINTSCQITIGTSTSAMITANSWQ